MPYKWEDASRHISEWMEPNAYIWNSRERGIFSTTALTWMFVGFKEVRRAISKLSCEDMLQNDIGRVYHRKPLTLPPNKDTLFRIFSAHLGQTHIDNFARDCIILNEEINNFTTYIRYKLSLIMLKRVKFLGLTNIAHSNHYI